MNYIYAIHCPFTSHVVYVGRSIHPEVRLKQHMCDRYSLVGSWCRAIKSLGYRPYMTILHSGYFCGWEANQIELEYINKFRVLKQANHNRDHCGQKCTVNFEYIKPLLLQIQDMKTIALLRTDFYLKQS